MDVYFFALEIEISWNIFFRAGFRRKLLILQELYFFSENPHKHSNRFLYRDPEYSFYEKLKNTLSGLEAYNLLWQSLFNKIIRLGLNLCNSQVINKGRMIII
jgi:hypothetical protein